MAEKLIIIGAGGHGKVIADIAKLIGYKEIYFLDDDINKHKIGEYQIIGTSKDIDKYKEKYDFIVGIGNNNIRKRFFLILNERKIKQPSLIHPSAVIDQTVNIGQGTVVMANVVINADSKIGNSCIINTSSSIDHDCLISNYTHISPGVHIAGTVSIGECSWVGIGATVKNNVYIGSDCIIGAGSVVIDNLLEPGTYIGVPARRIHA